MTPLKNFTVNKQKTMQTIAYDETTELGFSARHTTIDNIEMSPLNISQIKKDLSNRKKRLSK